MAKSKSSANRSILEWAKTVESSESSQQSGNSPRHYDSQDMLSSSTEDASDDHSKLIIRQPDGGDHHIEEPAEDAFERPSKNADVSIDPVVPGSPHQPLHV